MHEGRAERELSVERIEHSVVVSAPVERVFAQWQAGKVFAAPAEGLQSIRIAGDKVEWRAAFGGEEITREGDIVEREPGRRIAWRGDGNAGHIEFTSPQTGETLVTLAVECDLSPELGAREPGIDAVFAAALAELGVSAPRGN